MAFKPPALPTAPKEYDADYMNRMLRILTQHLNGQADSTAATSAADINNAAAKTALVAADELGFWDSVTQRLNKITWANTLVTLNGTYEVLSHKNAANGYAGLSATYQINFVNNAGAFTSLLTNANTAARTYTFPDKSMTVAAVDSETFTGTPAAPTAAVGTNTTQVATTAFVQSALLSRPSIGVRQTVANGAKTTAGYANMLSAGSGLALNLAATTTPMRVNFAAGATDYVTTLSADVTSVVSSIAVNNLSYITADYVSATAVTWGKTLALPQYGYAYPRANQALLHFDGTAGATTMLDDYGNTWTAQGGAKLQTNQVKFGTAGLGGSGTNNAMNGTTDYIKSTDITSLGSGSWAMRGWLYNTAWSATANVLCNLGNASSYGAAVGLNPTGKSIVALSSTGSSWNLANYTVGTSAIALNTYAYVELTYDAVAGKYFVYVNGVLDQTITSTSKVCAGSSGLWIGNNTALTAGYAMQGYIDEFEFLPYCDHPNGTTYTPPVAASLVATAGYSSDFFSIPDMTMYRVTGASVSAGTPPTLTAVNRVYVAEAVTGAASVSSVVNYALNGKYVSSDVSPLPGTGVAVSKNSNIGTTFNSELILEIECITSEFGYSVGDIVTISTTGSNATYTTPFSLTKTRNTVSFTVGSAASAFYLANKSTGATAVLTAANWKYRLIVTRF